MIRFIQPPRMEKWVRKNIDTRKVAKTAFEKNFYKRKRNNYFGENMENLREQREIETDREKDKELMQVGRNLEPAV